MKEQLLATLQTSKNYTFAVAESMPDKEYNFKPVESVWNFGELVHHIAYGIEWWENNFIKGEKVDWDEPAFKAKKKELLSYLDRSYASLKDTICKRGLDDKAIQGFHATLDHITHHRGQAVVYLRCKGIVPPGYAY